MSKEMTFFIYLLERYAEYKNQPASSILQQWDQLNISNEIFDLYEIYHSERIQNAFDDIDLLVQEQIQKNLQPHF